MSAVARPHQRMDAYQEGGPIDLTQRSCRVRSVWGVPEGHAMADDKKPDRMMRPWSVVLLGGFGVRQNDRWITLPPGTTRLVAFLALQARPAARTFVAGSLWIDHSQDRAFGNLRSALWRLRKHAGSLITADSRMVGLAPSVSVDVVNIAKSAEQLSQGGFSKDISLIIEQLSRELLPGWSDDWAVIAREHHRQRSLHALELLAQYLADSGRYALAIDTGLRAIEMEPLRESAHRVLIRAHIAEGNYSEAIRHYDNYVQLIRSELGISPSPMLLDSIRSVSDRHSDAIPGR